MDIAKADKFVLSQYDGAGHFYFSSSKNDYNLLSTCFGVMSLGLLGKLKAMPNGETDKIIKYITGAQGLDGRFDDNKISKNRGGSFDETYSTHQMTDFCLLALQNLETVCGHELRFMGEYRDSDSLTRWMAGLDWRNPWLVSNSVMFVLSFLIYENRHLSRDNRKNIDTIIEYLENSKNKHGFWGNPEQIDVHNQMAAAYHFYIYYTYLGHPIGNIDEIIDTTLRLQNYDGLFSYAGGGGSCDDLDAVDLLCRCTFSDSTVIGELIEPLAKTYEALGRNQNLDGGFCWAKRRYFDPRHLVYAINPGLSRLSKRDLMLNLKTKLANPVKPLLFRERLYWSYSGIEGMRIKQDESDLFSTWFRLAALALIEETLPDVCGAKYAWNLSRIPGLGFYKNC